MMASWPFYGPVNQLLHGTQEVRLRAGEPQQEREASCLLHFCGRGNVALAASFRAEGLSPEARKSLLAVLSAAGAEIAGVVELAGGESCNTALFASLHSCCIASGDVLVEDVPDDQPRGVLQVLLPLSPAPPLAGSAPAFALFLAPWQVVRRCLQRVASRKLDVVFDLDDTLVQKGPHMGGFFELTGGALPGHFDLHPVTWTAHPPCPFGILPGLTWTADLPPPGAHCERRVLVAFRPEDGGGLMVCDILVRQGWRKTRRLVADDSRFTAYVASLGTADYVQRVVRCVLDPEGELFKDEEGMRRIFSCSQQGMRKSLGALAAVASGLPLSFMGREHEALREMVYAWPAGIIFDDWPEVWRGGQQDWIYQVMDYGDNLNRERGGAVLRDVRGVVLDLHQRVYPPQPNAAEGLPAFLEAKGGELDSAMMVLSSQPPPHRSGPCGSAYALVPALQTRLFAARRDLVSRFAPLHQPGYEVQAGAARGLLVPASTHDYDMHGGSPGVPQESLYAQAPCYALRVPQELPAEEGRAPEELLETEVLGQERPPTPQSEPRPAPPASRREDEAGDSPVAVARALQFFGGGGKRRWEEGASGAEEAGDASRSVRARATGGENS